MSMLLQASLIQSINDSASIFSSSQVDNNVEFDSMDIQAQDEEEKYFDEDDDEEGCKGEEHMMTSAAAESQDSDDSQEDYHSFVVETDIRPGLQEPDKEKKEETTKTEEELVKQCKDNLEVKD